MDRTREPAGETGHRPAYLVFTDVDDTLIGCSSLVEILRLHLVRRHGEAHGGREFDRAVREFADARTGGAPREQINREYYRWYRGVDAAELAALGREWFESRVGDPGFFLTATERALRRHRAAGAEIVLVSGSFPPCLQPIAEHIGAAHVVGTEPVVRDGRYTGEIPEPVIGDGKRTAVRRLLAEHPTVDPGACYGYGDHPSDLPMLDCVGHPVAVGDHPELLRRLGERTVRS